MSISSEIERIQNAKNSLKSSINAKTDSTHQITNETIDEYANFVDSISTGGSGEGGDIDWSAIGYDSTPQSIIDDYNYAKQIQNNWIPAVNLSSKFAYDNKLVLMPFVDTSNATNMASMFNGCTNLKVVPLLNTSSVTNAQEMFRDCKNLKCIPLLDTSNIEAFNYMFGDCTLLEQVPIFDTRNATRMNNMFSNCNSLNDESLDNILQMCINTTNKYINAKTFGSIGFQYNTSRYPASRIEALPHYQDFINAGWTIGY